MTGIETFSWQDALPPQTRIVVDDNVARVAVPISELQRTAERLATDARLADMFADQQAGTDPVLRMTWALDGDVPRYLLTETVCTTTEYPSLSVVQPAAFIEECEIYEQFGLRPTGGGLLNRVALPLTSDQSFPAWVIRPSMNPPMSAHHTPSAERRSSFPSARCARRDSNPSTTGSSPAARRWSTYTCSPGTSIEASNGGSAG